MGVDQPKVSALLNGRLANFSSERLMRLFTALGQDVEIVVKAKPRSRERGRIQVIGAQSSGTFGWRLGGQSRFCASRSSRVASTYVVSAEANGSSPIRIDCRLM